jgi:hypothetical protein
MRVDAACCESGVADVHGAHKWYCCCAESAQGMVVHVRAQLVITRPFTVMLSSNSREGDNSMFRSLGYNIHMQQVTKTYKLTAVCQRSTTADGTILAVCCGCRLTNYWPGLATYLSPFLFRSTLHRSSTACL